MYGYPQSYYPQSYYDMIRAQMAPQPAQQANVLVPQQVLEVEGQKSINALRMSPNSSLIAADKTGPYVWMCVSDGIGTVTAKRYKITEEEDAPPFDIAGFAESVEGRLSALESKITAKEVKHDEQPDAASSRSDKPNNWASGKH